MRIIFLPFILLFVNALAIGQLSNKRSGNWSDPTLWSRNLVPNGADSVTLYFDVVIDESAACKFLHTNGHTVTVKTGVTFALGEPVLQADTATLLTISTSSCSLGIQNDTFHRVMKNSYVNGLRRIVITETDGSQDTMYNTFNYNSKGQLESMLQYDNVDTSFLYRTTIIRTNNLVTKVVAGVHGYPQLVSSLSYSPNGLNTDVQAIALDTFYGSGTSIVSTTSTKTVLTVSPAFEPIEKNMIGHTLYAPGLQEQFDTSRTIYLYDERDNLSGYWDTYHSTFTYDPPYRAIDTSNFNFVRNNPDSASVYTLLLDVFGKELLTLLDFGLIPLEIRDVIGYAYPPSGFGEYRKQTLTTLTGSTKQYQNDKLEFDPAPKVIYRAVNQFDSRQRLVNSIIDNGDAESNIINMTLVYPR